MRSNLKLSLLLIIITSSINISSLNTHSASASTGATELLNGIASYNSGDYASAITHLRRATAADPTNATAHYYFACAFQHSGDPNNAIVEYHLAQELDREGTIKKYASKALASYTVPGAAAASNGAAQGAASGNTADEAVKRAKEEISRQAQENQLLIKHNSSANVQSTQNTGKSEADRLTQTRDNEINRMMNAHWKDQNGHYQPLYSQSQIDDKKNEYDQLIKAVNDRTAEAVQRHQTVGSETAAALNDSASSLQSQLGTGVPGSNAVRLLPNGTNLFVRSYAAASAQSASPAQSELMATQKQLILVPHKVDNKSDWQVVPAGQAADQDKLLLFQQKKPIQLKVHGVVVPTPTVPAAVQK